MIPPLFKAVPGHQIQINWLKSTASRDLWSGAYLFCGPADSGLLTLAHALAVSGNCESAPGITCGECASCRMAISGIHPEITLLTPSRGIIGIDPVRELRRDINLKPAYGRRRFVIIHPAGAMNASAQNCILKILEEPPEHVTFILVCSSSSGLLPTIKSRCATINFGMPSRDEVHDWLLRYDNGLENLNGHVTVALETRGLLEIDPRKWASAGSWRINGCEEDVANIELPDLSSVICEKLEEELEAAHSLQSLQEALRTSLYSVALPRKSAVQRLWSCLEGRGRLSWLAASSIVCDHISRMSVQTEKIVKSWSGKDQSADCDSASARAFVALLETGLFTTASESLFRRIARKEFRAFPASEGFGDTLTSGWNTEISMQAASALAETREQIYRNVNTATAMDTAFLTIYNLRKAAA